LQAAGSIIANWVFFFPFFFGANFGHLATKNKGGRRGAANCPKDFVSGKKGPQSPYFKEKQKKVKLAIFRALVVVLGSCMLPFL
jgi:hypothetical protein